MCRRCNVVVGEGCSAQWGFLGRCLVFVQLLICCCSQRVKCAQAGVHFNLSCSSLFEYQKA